MSHFINGDIRDKGAVDEAMENQECVVHLAAQTGVIPSIENPVEDCEVNVRGTLNLLQAASGNKVKRFIAASSSAPVGACAPPMHEDLPTRPTAPYGASKAAMESYCSAWHHSFGLNTVVLRFSNCYGAGSINKSSIVALFMKKILAGEKLTIYGDGEQTRDFIYVEDLCRAIELVLKYTPDKDGSPFGQIYQAATGVETSINELLDLMRELIRPSLGQEIAVEYSNSRAGEVVRNFSEISHIRNTFEFKPQISLEEGLNRTWTYFSKNDI